MRTGDQTRAGNSARPVPDIPRPIPELVQFWFDDVTRVEGPGGMPARRDHLGLFIDERGMEVSAPTETYRIPWIKVSSVSLGAAEAAPDGSMVRPFDVITMGERFRLLLAASSERSTRVDALEELLPRWSVVAVDTVPPTVFAPVPEEGLSLGTGDPTVAHPGPHDRRLLPFPASPYGAEAEPRRTRRVANLLVGMVLVLAAVGLALVLSRPSSHHAASPATTRPTSTSRPPSSTGTDEQLAQRMMLTEADLPTGWSVDGDNSASGTSSYLRSGEARITAALATCMGITAEQGNVVLGGEAPDETAEATSPIFAAPSTHGDPGFALQLQTAATVVRTSADQVRDSALLDNPRYPGCEATAVASELQLGANHSSGESGEPGPATAIPLPLSAPTGEKVSALVLSFTVTDHDASLPVEVEVVSIGSNRVEANFQAFAVGGDIPPGSLDSPVATLEQKVATATPATSV